MKLAQKEWNIYFYFLFYLHSRFKVWIELLDLSDSLKYFIPSEPIWLSIPNIYSKKRFKKMELITYFDNNLIITFWFIVFYFYFLFYLHSRFKVWIELLDLSNSIKYFIPSEPILFPIPNIYSKKKWFEKWNW